MQVFLHSVQFMQEMTFAEIHVKWSVLLTDRFGPQILTILEIKGQVLHRVRVHLKVPGWLSDLIALLTRKLPTCMFSFGIIAENFRPFSTRLIKPHFPVSLCHRRRNHSFF